MNPLFPMIPRRELRPILCYAGLGAALAGTYGIAHDLITYSIAPEYFTAFKFSQFAWMDIGLPPRAFAGLVGFFGAAWVGGIVGWFLARAAVPHLSPKIVRALLTRAFIGVAAGALAGGFAGFVLGKERREEPDFTNWAPILDFLTVSDPAGFVHVAYIHNAGYAGALVGLLFGAGLLIRAKKIFAGAKNSDSGK